MPGGARLADSLPDTKLRNHTAIHAGHMAVFSGFSTHLLGNGGQWATQNDLEADDTS